MKRIGYLLVLLLFSVGGQAQLSVDYTDTIVCEYDTVWFTATGYDSITWSGTATLDNILGESNFAIGTEGVYNVRIIGWDTVGVATSQDTVDVSVEFIGENLFSVTSDIFYETFDCGQDTLSVEACLSDSFLFQTTGADSVWYSSTSLTISHDSLGSANVTPAVGTAFILIDGLVTSSGDRDTLVVELTTLALPSILIHSSAEEEADFICFGSSAELTVLADTSTLDFITWGADTTLDTLMEDVVVAMADSMTDYKATVTDIYGCEASRSKTVRVGYDTPTFDLSISPNNICPGDSTELEGITITGAAVRYEWSPTSTLSDSEGRSVFANPTVSTTYGVTATAQGCQKDSSVTVNVLSAPVMNATQSAMGSIKLDETTVITVNCQTCLSYVWFLPGATLSTTSNVQTVSPNTAGINTIIIEGTDSNSCNNETSIVVTVDSSFAGEPWPPTSVNEIDANNISVFAKAGEIIINSSSSPITQLAAYNVLGAKIYEASNIGQNRVEISSGNLASGVYILKVNTTSAEKTAKVYLR